MRLFAPLLGRVLLLMKPRPTATLRTERTVKAQNHFTGNRRDDVDTCLVVLALRRLCKTYSCPMTVSPI